MFIIHDETGDASVAGAIEELLRMDLRNANVQAVNSDITLTVRTGDRNIVAGLVGFTSYGWLMIKALWVAQGQRRAGIGRALYARACQLALDRRCHSVWLDTSNQASMAFYRSVELEVFAVIANEPGQFPVDHHRWFMHGRLTGKNTDLTATSS